VAERRSLDHFVIATKDVEVAGAQYERLGFQVMPVMRHVEIGTCNRVFQLQDSFVELLGDIDRAPEYLREKLVDRFHCGEGLTLVSLTSDDLPGDREILDAAGLKPAPIVNARRKVRMPEGHFDETDSRCVYTWNAEFSMSLFLSHHYKPHVIWSAAYQLHPNTATRVTKLTYVAQDPQAFTDYISAMIGFPPTRQEDGVVSYRTKRGETLELLTPAKLQAQFGGEFQPCTKLSAYGIGLEIAVTDLDACRGILSRNGVPCLAAGHRVVVHPDAAAGTILEFVQA
jgi:hypothetical protein